MNHPPHDAQGGRRRAIVQVGGGLRIFGISYNGLAFTLFFVVWVISRQIHPTWAILLSVPLVNLFARAIADRRFEFVVLLCGAALLFLLLGSVWGLWHPGWLVFCAVPVVQSALTAYRSHDCREFSFAGLVAILYLFIGFTVGGWHPYWLLFLLIPLYEQWARWFTNQA
ncbi:MAG: hypothetical protein WDA00_02365 [Eubacteriales bacterium]